mmetsp:Transcript_66782/g.159775  ORF Transcript_66782/g.159775 Transcript_66782/m.159775 type:complete len:250 (+) Transcript_66782:199-948(+)
MPRRPLEAANSTVVTCRWPVIASAWVEFILALACLAVVVLDPTAIFTSMPLVLALGMANSALRLHIADILWLLAEPVLALHVVEASVLMAVGILWRDDLQAGTVWMHVISGLGGVCLLASDFSVVVLRRRCIMMTGRDQALDHGLPLPPPQLSSPCGRVLMTRTAWTTRCMPCQQKSGFGFSTSCMICLDDFQPESGEEEVVCELSCGHCFHKACLKQWARTRAAAPLCPLRCDVYHITAVKDQRILHV